MATWQKWVFGILAGIILLPAVPEIIKGLRESIIQGVRGSTATVNTVNQVNPQGQVSVSQQLPNGSFIDFQGQVWGRVKDDSAPATGSSVIHVDEHNHHYHVVDGGAVQGGGQQVVEQCVTPAAVYCEQPATTQWCANPATARASASYNNSFNRYIDRSRNAPFIDLSGLISLNVANGGGGFLGGGGGYGFTSGGYWDNYYASGSSICGGGLFGGGGYYYPRPQPRPQPPVCAPPQRYRSY
ncbi:MAG: hypothetical protein FJY91_00515 [Candidatus Harrisonbacteria bacterium]|nr:hypothetical protein [Candidatus Harrisonbacteria bacterium]